MNINSRISIGIRRFFKKNWKIIVAGTFIWLVVFTINQVLKNNKKNENEISKTYNPDKPIMTYDSETVPKKYRETIKETIDKYFNYCKAGDYQQSFEMLTDSCKSYLYDNNVENFKAYYTSFFDNQDKIYYIQNYSNVDKYYMYDFCVLNDIETTGSTGGNGEKREKLVLSKEGDSFKISNQGYFGNKTLDKVAEDENMRVKVNSKDISYEKEGYNITITNKTDKYILIADSSYADEVTLNLGDQKRKATNTSAATFLVAPNSSKTYTFIFSKFADDGVNPMEINFNDVRIYSSYNTSLTPEQANKLYSFNIDLTK